MASITTATSGLASAPSTWIGGVVPGTTFAGTRTTTGTLLAIGTTSIPVTSTGSVVTAGKWLKVSGGNTMYRVATGLAASTAGNIVIDAPGLAQAIPASATTISIDMVDDQVTLAHPGTNNPGAGTQYLLNGAHSAGAVTIAVNTGTNTILAGECIQLEHQIGTDEDGQAIYDNTYYKVATSLTAGVIVIASPGLSYSMAAGVRVRNRGHVVEQDLPFAVWGSDGSGASAASNGILIAGTFKASRSGSNTLVARGTIFGVLGGKFDQGVTGDIIPSGVVSTVAVNDSGTLAGGKHGLLSHTNCGDFSWSIAGVQRTRNTRLSAGISASGTSMSVDAADNWAQGDQIVIASDTDAPSRAQVVTLGAGSGLTWPVSPAITNARVAGTRVGNLSSNVIIKSYSASFPGVCGFAVASSNAFSQFCIRDVRFENIGGSTGWASIANTPLYFGVGMQPSDTSFRCQIKRAAHYHASNLPNALFSSDSICRIPATYVDCAAYFNADTSVGCYASQNGASQWTDTVVYRSATAIQSAFSAGASPGRVTGGAYWGAAIALNASAGEFELDAVDLHAVSAIIGQTVGRAALNNCTLSAARVLQGNTVNGTGQYVLSNCTFAGSLLTGNVTTGNRLSPDTSMSIVAANGTAADNRNINYHRVCTTDLTTRKRGAYAVKIQPKIANTAITYVFTIPAVAGVAQDIKGALQFDATYGTATPPSIELVGQGITQSHTCAAVADEWDDFAFSFTPASTGDITATVTVQSTSTAGFAWLDGVYHYPMIQAVRHWGYQWLPQAAQIADARITLTEAAALALPVAVDHALATVTISGAVTPSQALQAMLVDLVQTANNGRAVHVTGDGSTFSTTYTVILVGAGAVSGPYSDSAGRHVRISAPNLIADTRVYLYDDTNGALLANVKLTAPGLSYPVVWTADRSISYRFGYAEGLAAKQRIRGAGVLGANGLTILDSQVDNSIYNTAVAIDGSTCTEFTPDFPNLQIDLPGTDPVRSTIFQRLYAWSTWAETSEAGIALMFGAVQSDDGVNFTIDPAIVDAKLQNPNADTTVVISGGTLRRTDGSSWIVPGPGIILPDMGKAYLAAGSIPAAPSATTVASAVRAELAPELAATLQARDLAEADVVFSPGGAAGTGTLAYHRRGTTSDLIPPKAVAGTSQTQASGATQ